MNIKQIYRKMYPKVYISKELNIEEEFKLILNLKSTLSSAQRKAVVQVKMLKDLEREKTKEVSIWPEKEDCYAIHLNKNVSRNGARMLLFNQN